jgi:hypothetical protein
MDLLNWVNVIWFTDLFEYSDSQSNSIASVINRLEEADENGLLLSSYNINKYIKAVNKNNEVK